MTAQKTKDVAFSTKLLSQTFPNNLRDASLYNLVNLVFDIN